MSLIDRLKSEALSFPQLQFLAGKRQTQSCRWIVYDDLRNYKTIDQLMALGACVILLEIETLNKPRIGHFIIILKHKDHYEHFDSYGIGMDEELSLTKEHHLSNIFRNSKVKIVDNTKRLQRLREDINTCGRWVVARLLLRHVELDPFLALFEHLKPQSPDEMISWGTLLLQYDK